MVAAFFFLFVNYRYFWIVNEDIYISILLPNCAELRSKTL